MHVLIIGGGTGGMCLAHGLKKAGVSVAVYERYGSRRDGLYGYRVGIDPTGSRALHECLPPELFDTFVATSAREPRHFNVLTQSLRTTATFPLPPARDAVGSERSVSRATLRQVLFTGMDDVVHYGKEFTRYEQHPDGTISAHFSDGTTATGDVLIAADGTRSAVRRQFLPHAEIKDAGVTAIATKTALTPETRALLPDEALNGLSLIFGTKGMIGMLHVMTFKRDAQGSCPGLEFDTDRDYINLSIWSSHDHFPEDTTRRRGRQLIATALEAAANWHPNLRRIFELSDPEAAFPLKIATSAPVDPWPTTNITLLGDAIHTMTPGRGVGANTALRDATLLCRELTAVAGGRKELLAAIGDYEAEMIPYGFARVAESLTSNGTSGDDPLFRPVIGRLALFAARSYFAATSRVPALRRKFLADLSASRGEDLASS
ncbi:NAD(P)/FAD-dependent oxidoreductase [Streptomyces sp. MK37H]|uniref:FAD-dependent oxidoreductase n=1 Tax=Streptomyces sp. MK37H TaxID=2699117 RepID=UPI001B37C100|nr:NAD(P)/FAD-dependent oxidoreductase [Streptomyces sp. MK37H]MBP8532935.1 FAD-dependent monooxygenase [Streptomyces sp. MK37H]